MAGLPLEAPRAFPARLMPIVRSLTGGSSATYTTGRATRRALRAARAHGATTGTTVHLPGEPGSTEPALLAHELVHARNPIRRPRFSLHAPHSAADADERTARATEAAVRAAGFGSGLPAGFGSGLPAGFGSGLPAGFGSGPPAGFGSGLPAGFGSALPAGFGSGLPAGFGSGPPAGIGSGLPAGFGSAPPAGFVSALPVGGAGAGAPALVETAVRAAREAAIEIAREEVRAATTSSGAAGPRAVARGGPGTEAHPVTATSPTSDSAQRGSDAPGGSVGMSGGGAGASGGSAGTSGGSVGAPGRQLTVEQIVRAVEERLLEQWERRGGRPSPF
ncbi:DUF4157 domain-containing protein [Actinoplanes sp. NPDC049265]|uniref:eCIS core domain-containing protein n=1 Tax=Actinoplanes sp. NPDC049265 TaxID=3363902 RepID=UPI00371F4D2E